ncbi:MAG: hypothetical protein AB7L90_05770 [Hyphomicrobiaceae bacterium]
MRRKGAFGSITALGCLVVLPLGLAGCAGNAPAELVDVTAGGRCVDDSPSCIKARQSELNLILADKQKHWIRRPATADSYAGGVRLFAYKKRKRELSCAELTLAHKEAEAGPAVLRGPAGKHLTPAQVSRGAMLSAEVSRELHQEMRRRCRG